MTMLERRPNDSGEGSHSESSNYTASTPSFIKNRYPSQIHQVDQFLYKKRDQNYYNNKVDSSSDQLLPQDYESMTRVPHRFYRQVTYDDQSQAYAFVDTSARVPAENSMYVILHEQTKRNFIYNPLTRQFWQIVKDCE